MKDTKNKEQEGELAAQPSKANQVSYLQLYREASALDWVLIVIGSLFALANGTLLPLFTIFFGDVLNELGLSNLLDTDQDVSKALKVMADGVNDISLKFVYIACATFIGSWIEITFWQLAAINQTNRIRVKYLKALLRQNIGFFDAESSKGELIQALTDEVNHIQLAIGDKVGQTMQHLGAFISGIAIGFAKGWDMALVMLACMPIIGVAGFLMGKAISFTQTRTQASYASAQSTATSAIANVRTVAAYTSQEFTTNKYREQLQYPTKVARKVGFIGGMFAGLANACFFFTYAIALWYGGVAIRREIIKDPVTQLYMMEPDARYHGGRVMNVLFAVIISSFSLGQIAPNIEYLQRGQSAGYKVFQIVDRQPDIRSNNPDKPSESQTNKSQQPNKSITNFVGLKEPFPVAQGRIEFRNVEFAYPVRADFRVFRGFSLDIASGQTVALVGSSGSGKSTAVQLLQRFYDVDKGAVLVDGKDVRDWSLAHLRRNMGLVSQEPALFATTIFGNIAYGVEECDLQQVMDAARAASAHRFISQLPDGYNTWVGEAGVQLSGGQKQRIAIARAILRNPKILLLDEATSALDTANERVVQRAIDAMISQGGRTTVVIAHRLSTVQGADQIAVVKEGQVVEQGTHSDLINKSGGQYSTLVALQKAAAPALDDTPANVDVDEIPPQDDKPLSQSSIHPDKPPSSKLKSQAHIAQPHPSGISKKKIDTNEEEEAATKVGLTRLLQYNKPELLYAFFGVITSFIVGLSFPAFGFAIAEMVNVFYELDPDKQRKGTTKWALIIAGIGLAYFFIVIIQQYSFATMAANLTLRIRVLLLRAITYQDISFFDREANSSGALTAKLANDAASVRGAVGDTMGVMTQNLVTFLGGFVIAFIYGWQMALVMLATFPLLAFGMWMQFKLFSGMDAGADEDYAQATSTVNEALGQIRTVQAYGLESRIEGLYTKTLEKPIKKNKIRAWYSGAIFGFSQCVIYLIYAVAYYVAGQLIEDGKMTFGEVLKVFFGIIFGAMGLSQAQMVFPEVAKAGPAVKRIFSVVDRPRTIDADSAEGARPGAVQGALQLSNVTFAYPARPEVVVFNKFNLTVGSGKKVALVGESGSGKSTVVSLLERFYDPLSGNITLDGVDIKTLNLTWYRQQFGLVSQEPVLFSASVADNIRYGSPEATMAQVEAAAKVANASEFISALSDGFDTSLGDQSVQLSGGQKQRIAIARAVLRDPKILLLDEATSALDAISEADVQRALDKVMVGRTTVAIAHRLTTVRDFDSIAVVQSGIILEQGSHEELMQLPQGNYVKLVQAQAQR